MHDASWVTKFRMDELLSRPWLRAQQYVAFGLAETLLFVRAIELPGRDLLTMALIPLRSRNM